MFKKILISIVLLFSLRAYSQDQERYINVVATSLTNLKADVVDISIYIKHIKESLAASKNAYEKSLNDLVDVLNNYKSNESDIKILPLSFGKNYKYVKSQRFDDGYYTSGSVNFKLENIDSYYDLMDKLIEIENISVSYSRYNSSEYEKYNKITYENAVRTAKEKAEYMAAAAGVKLIRVMEIEDVSSGNYGLQQNYPNPFNSSTTVNSNTDNFVGNIEISRSVRVKYEIHELPRE